jgi:hypothetical protein
MKREIYRGENFDLRRNVIAEWRKLHNEKLHALHSFNKLA